MEFNTRVLWVDTHECSSTRKTPQHSEELYDPRLTISIIDYLLKDKINTKFAFQPNIWQIYDQIDRMFYSKILWRFEERLIPNCAFQPNIWQIYDYSAIFNWEWKWAWLTIKANTLKCKLLIRKEHNYCANIAINTSNQLYGVHCGAL
jgi:hypothetical protein